MADDRDLAPPLACPAGGDWPVIPSTPKKDAPATAATARAQHGMESPMAKQHIKKPTQSKSSRTTTKATKATKATNKEGALVDVQGIEAKRASVELSAEDAATLEQMAQRQGVSPNEALHRILEGERKRRTPPAWGSIEHRRNLIHKLDACYQYWSTAYHHVHTYPKTHVDDAGLHLRLLATARIVKAALDANLLRDDDGLADLAAHSRRYLLRKATEGWKKGSGMVPFGDLSPSGDDLHPLGDVVIDRADRSLGLERGWATSLTHHVSTLRNTVANWLDKGGDENLKDLARSLLLHLTSPWLCHWIIENREPRLPVDESAAMSTVIPAIAKVLDARRRKDSHDDIAQRLIVATMIAVGIPQKTARGIFKTEEMANRRHDRRGGPTSG